MKIGQFAKVHQVSIDTIRHYMDLKLLVPVKEGAHYHFDERTQDEMRWIIRLKNLGFTLSEIKSLLSFTRIGKMTDYQQSDLYRKIFIDRLEKLKVEIENLEIHRERLGQEIIALDQSGVLDRQNFGIPLDSLSLFACSECGGELRLKSAEIVDDEIISGELVCECGRRYPVKDGILYSDGNIHEEKSYNYIEKISDYILATPEEYIDRLYTSIGWGYSVFEELDQKDRVALDLGSGLGVFLRNIYEKLDDTLTYIVVDHNVRMHLLLKDILVKAAVKKRIIFIAADFNDLPLKKETVDIVVDVAGSSNYAFDNNAFLIREIDSIVSKEATLLSGLLMFDNFTSDSQIKQDRRWLFTQASVVRSIEELGYRLESVKETDRVTEGGIYENFFMPGEKIYSLLVTAKRWG
jgi:DNA-binding transcriptional MerR regulator/SAM-dependent methyltransferase